MKQGQIIVEYTSTSSNYYAGLNNKHYPSKLFYHVVDFLHFSSFITSTSFECSKWSKLLQGLADHAILFISLQGKT